MQWWIKIDCRVFDHPKVRAAGGCAGPVFIYLLCTNGKYRCEGKIPLKYATARIIAAGVNLKLAEVREALDGLADPEVGLITLTDTHVVLNGWDAKWRAADKKGAERQRKYRERKTVTVTPCDVTGDVTEASRDGCVTSQDDAVTGALRLVTLRDVELELEYKRECAVATAPGISPQVSEVIGYLNVKANKRYRCVPEHAKRIARWLQRGHSVEDMRRVIDAKVAEWKGTKLDYCLRPKTLFSENFTTYFDQLDSGGTALAEADPERWREKFNLADTEAYLLGAGIEIYWLHDPDRQRMTHDRLGNPLRPAHELLEEATRRQANGGMRESRTP